MWLCTPPSESSPSRCRAEPRARSNAAANAGLCANAPASMSSSIRTRSCRTTRPAPRLRWPTSELPIWPSGRPTARPEAASVVCGKSRHRRSNTGVWARSTALPGPGGASPQPSSTTRQTGRRSCRRVDDREEAVDVEAGAADQAAVDIGLLRAARPRCRASCCRRTGSALLAPAPRAPPGCGRARPGPSPAWRSARCRSPTPARRRSWSPPPARRVSAASAPSWRSSTCSVAPSRRSASLSPTARITAQAGRMRRGQLLGQSRVGLVEVLAPLGVAEQHAVDAEVEQHRRRDLAGERALGRLVHVLGEHSPEPIPRRPSTAAASAVNGTHTATSTPAGSCAGQRGRRTARPRWRSCASSSCRRRTAYGSCAAPPVRPPRAACGPRPAPARRRHRSRRARCGRRRRPR